MSESIYDLNEKQIKLKSKLFCDSKKLKSFVSNILFYRFLLNKIAVVTSDNAETIVATV